MSGWTPPASGTPCWINISAQDVQRAKKFYSSVFGWEFQDNSQPDKYPPENIAFWHPPDRKTSPSGAISKTDGVNYTKLSTPNRGSAGLYLYVDDLEAYIKKISQAGGKKAGEILPEGMGSLQHFEDTEGNYFGLYMVNPQVGE